MRRTRPGRRARGVEYGLHRIAEVEAMRIAQVKMLTMTKLPPKRRGRKPRPEASA
jgi:hypothetical protein